MLCWRTEEFPCLQSINIKTPEEEILEGVYNTSLVISMITGKITNDTREDWMKTRMSHLQLFALEEEKKKERPKEEIVSKEFWKYLNTVFSEREVGRLPSCSSYDHKIEMKPGYEPQRGVLYRQGPQHDQALREFLDEHLPKVSFINPNLLKPHHSSSSQRRMDKQVLSKTINTSMTGPSKMQICFPPLMI
jgi:hypothetical protein